MHLEIRLRVERLFEEVLLPAAASVEERTRKLLDLYSQFDAHARDAVFRILKDKLKYVHYPSLFKWSQYAERL